ncbi:hypothetical protein P9Z89_24110, partial [Bacillus thuringiensis]|nr:hypothetical protein [Bacillus thuringiensis]
SLNDSKPNLTQFLSLSKTLIFDNMIKSYCRSCSIRGTASISEKNHAKKIRVKKSENISLFQDTYSVFFYTKNNTTQY